MYNVYTLYTLVAIESAKCRFEHLQHCFVLLRCFFRFGIVSVDYIIRKDADGIMILTRSEVLKRPHAHVTCGHSRQDRTGQRAFAKHLLAGGDRSE